MCLSSRSDAILAGSRACRAWRWRRSRWNAPFNLKPSQQDSFLKGFFICHSASLSHVLFKIFQYSLPASPPSHAALARSQRFRATWRRPAGRHGTRGRRRWRRRRRRPGARGASEPDDGRGGAEGCWEGFLVRLNRVFFVGGTTLVSGRGWVKSRKSNMFKHETRCRPRTRMQSRRTLLWSKLFEESCTFSPSYRGSAL